MIAVIPQSVGDRAGLIRAQSARVGLNPEAAMTLLIALVIREHRRFMAAGLRPEDPTRDWILSLSIPQGFKPRTHKHTFTGRGGASSVAPLVGHIKNLAIRNGSDVESVVIALYSGEGVYRNQDAPSTVGVFKEVRDFFGSDWPFAAAFVERIDGKKKGWNPGTGRCRIRQIEMECYKPLPRSRRLDLISGNYSGPVRNNTMLYGIGGAAALITTAAIILTRKGRTKK